MSEHTCHACGGSRAAITEAKREIAHMLRIVEQRPGSALAKASLARIPTLKARIQSSRQWLTDHMKESA